MNHVRRSGLQLFLEPGRSISASAGALISEVQLIKQIEGRVRRSRCRNEGPRAPAIYGCVS